ncbi:MAG: S8 family peptidase, partial [bacterium]
AQDHNKVTAIVELERPGAEIFEGTGVAVKHVYPGGRTFDVEADLEKLEQFSLVSGVISTSLDFELTPDLKQGLALIGANKVRPDFDGSGIAIAIIDSGVDPTHPMLGGSAVCDSKNFTNDKVIGGWDTGEKDSLPCDSSKHGTSVAGIAAGLVPDKSNTASENYVGGVAPGAKIYALKITKANGRPGSNAYLAALRWIGKHWNDDPKHPILVVNNSNTWNKPGNESCQHDKNSYGNKVIAALEYLNKLGITVFNSAGNAGSARGVQWPGCMDRVQSVGAVRDTNDLVLGSSNTGDLLDFFAPANPTITTVPGGKYGKFGTTSAAAAYAAGAAAVIQQAAIQKLGHYLEPSQLLSVLRDSGKMVGDPKTKPLITRPRIDLLEAIRLLDRQT